MTPRKTTRVLLVEDHTLLREALAAGLAAYNEFIVAGQCATVTEALLAVESGQVDLVLLDYDLGPEKGTRFIEEARKRGWKTPVLIVTGWISTMEARRLVAEGVSGIFPKHKSTEELVEAMRTVAAGGAWYEQKYIKAVLGRTDPAAPRPPEFSREERQVLRNVLEGMSNKEIGVELSLTEAVVKRTLQHLFEKCGVHSRAALVRVVLERGFLS